MPVKKLGVNAHIRAPIAESELSRRPPLGFSKAALLAVDLSRTRLLLPWYAVPSSRAADSLPYCTSTGEAVLSVRGGASRPDDARSIASCTADNSKWKPSESGTHQQPAIGLWLCKARLLPRGPMRDEGSTIAMDHARGNGQTHIQGMLSIPWSCSTCKQTDSQLQAPTISVISRWHQWSAAST